VEAADVLAKAFLKDPVTRYLVPDEKERRQFLPYFFRSMVTYGIRYGEVYTYSPHFEGIIIWLPGEAARMSMWKMFRSKGYSMIYTKADGEVKKRMFYYFDFVTERRKANSDFAHWFLLFIGVKPELQGKGYGGKLMTPMFQRLDPKTMPCCLETQNEKSLGFYERYGFEVIEETKIPKTDLTYWALLRKQ
jgi:ribosomal protein S18 acetylase RimI-like enzyme